jgi:hypothetical protein
MSKLSRKFRKCVEKGCYPFKFDFMDKWAVYTEGEWEPRYNVGSKRDAINLAYHISLQPNVVVKITRG